MSVGPSVRRRHKYSRVYSKMPSPRFVASVQDHVTLRIPALRVLFPFSFLFASFCLTHSPSSFGVVRLSARDRSDHLKVGLYNRPIGLSVSQLTDARRDSMAERRRPILFRPTADANLPTSAMNTKPLLTNPQHF